MTQVKSPSSSPFSSSSSTVRRRRKYHNNNRRQQSTTNNGSIVGSNGTQDENKLSGVDDGSSSNLIGNGGDITGERNVDEKQRKLLPLSCLLETVNEIVVSIEHAQQREKKTARSSHGSSTSRSVTTTCNGVSCDVPAASLNKGAKSEPTTAIATDVDSRFGNNLSSKMEPSSWRISNLDTVHPKNPKSPETTSSGLNSSHMTSGSVVGNANLLAQGTFAFDSSKHINPVITRVETSAVHTTSITNANGTTNGSNLVESDHTVTSNDKMASTTTISSSNSAILSRTSPHLVNPLQFPVIDYDADNEDNRSSDEGKGSDRDDSCDGDDNDSNASECGADLTKFTKEQLNVKLAPIMNTLKILDVKSLLPLEDCEVNSIGAAEAGNGMFVKAIHNKVEPPVVAPVRYQFQKDNSGSSNKFTPVRYIHVYELPNHYSAGVFVFPPFAKIPLHDHPGMCVLSRILYGSLSLYSYDWIEGETPRTTYVEEKKKNGDDDSDDSSKDDGMSVDSDDDDMEDPMEKLIRSRLQALGTANSVSNSWLGKATQEFSKWSSKAMKASSTLMGSGTSMELEDEGDTSTTTKRREQVGRRRSSSRRQPPINKIPIVKRLARLRPVKTVTAPMVTTLYPYEGNVHEFVAGPNGAAVLDVLLPPYDEDHDRDCTFYVPEWETSTTTSTTAKDSYSNCSSSEIKVLLRQVPQPDDFQCIGGTYGNVGSSE